MKKVVIVSLCFYFCFCLNIKNISFSAIEDNYLQYVKKNFASSNDEVIYDDKGLFIVLCPNPDLAKKILNKENKLYQRFLNIFKTLTFWKRPTIIKICYSRSEYIEKFNAYGSAAFMAKFRKDSMSHRLIASWIQDNLLTDILPHETAHLFVADLAKVDKINSQSGKPVLPHWINEGIAQIFEENKDLLLFKIFMIQIALNEKGHIPFDKFFRYTKYPDNTYFFYIQSEIITRFLLSTPNGQKYIRNYITIFRSKVKDGYEAFKLSFKSLSNDEVLRKKFLHWCINILKTHKPNIKKINRKLINEISIKKSNQNLYKEIAFGMVAYQHYLNKNYKKALTLSEKSLKQQNNFYLSYDTYIKTLYKLNKNKKADLMLEHYKTINKIKAYNLIASIKREEKKYTEEIEWLKRLLDIDKANGYFYCMRLAYIYATYFGDYKTAEFYLNMAKIYTQPVDKFF